MKVEHKERKESELFNKPRNRGCTRPQKTYCLYEASDPEAIREAARRAGLPADVIVEVNEINPAAFA